jgi:hypothetical protein
MKLTITLLSVLLVEALTSTQLRAQDEGFIYGKVTTTDGVVYEGPIRWGKEEVYWVDLFNAGKEENKNLRYLSSKERDELEERNYSWSNWSENGITRWFGWHDSDGNNRDNDFAHQFVCQFGELKSITPDGRRYVDIEMRNGDRYTLKGEGYNDVGLAIRILDPEMGEVDMSWSRIRTIEFLKTPKKLAATFGKPLYGTVEAYGETFTGYIQWDHDERVSTDKLDGDSEDGKLAIEFEKIASIERVGGRSLVQLKSGRKITLDGSNDVDNGNRGIIIMNSEIVAIDVPWKEFNKVTFRENTTSGLVTYDNFSNQRALSGTLVTNDGKSLTGKIVFDLDEAYTYEVLQGEYDNLKFITAFKNIKVIEPQSSSRSMIQLVSGKKIMLEDAQDVDERNQGVLVFAGGNTDPIYVEWENVKVIRFE